MNSPLESFYSGKDTNDQVYKILDSPGHWPLKCCGECMNGAFILAEIEAVDETDNTSSFLLRPI